jgi:hypothetical protein
MHTINTRIHTLTQELGVVVVLSRRQLWGRGKLRIMGYYFLKHWKDAKCTFYKPIQIPFIKRSSLEN